MSKSSYLDSVVNSSYKHKELQIIKDEIKKMFPHKVKDSSSEKAQYTSHSKMIKTITSFVNISVDKEQIAKHARLTHTQQLFLPKQFQEKARQRQIKKQGGFEDQGQHMSMWRQEMMKHIRPHKDVNIEEQEKKQRNRTRIKRMMEDHRSQSEKVVLKIRTSPLAIKRKIQSTIETNGFSSQSQKNIILIRPTTIGENERKDRKIRNRSVKIVPRPNKKIVISDWQKQHSILDRLALQRLASFEALLPYLGSRKAKVEQKPERKEKAAARADLELNKKRSALKREKVEESNHLMENISIEVPENITGWDIED